MSFILLQNSSIFQIFKPTIFTSLFQVLIEYSLYEATWIGSDNFSFFEKKKRFILSRIIRFYTGNEENPHKRNSRNFNLN